MPLLKQKVDITCPFCENEFEADLTQVTCEYCNTVIYLDEKGKIKEHDIPEFHDQLFYGALILGGIFALLIIAEAVARDHTKEKLMVLGVVLGAGS
jgi:hypothetical protein